MATCLLCAANQHIPELKVCRCPRKRGKLTATPFALDILQICAKIKMFIYEKTCVPLAELLTQ